MECWAGTAEHLPETEGLARKMPMTASFADHPRNSTKKTRVK
jgi:hypothetical protein